MIQQLVAILEQKFTDLTAEEIADILWLTFQQWQSEAAESPEIQVREFTSGPSTIEVIPADPTSVIRSTYESPEPAPVLQPSPMAGLTTRSPAQKLTKSVAHLDAPLAIPDAPALRSTLEILKALRPLIRQAPSAQASYLDVPATVRSIAETDLWSLQLRPVLEPWLELAIVVDATASMVIWQRTILGLRRILAQSGAFRDVRMWSLETQDALGQSTQESSLSELQLCIRSGFGPAATLQPPCRPQELIDPNGRRLILVISDCIDLRWETQQIRDLLQVWATHGPMALVQVLPEWLWDRTALSEVSKGQLYSLTPGQPNQSLTFVRRERWRRQTPAGVKVPVITLEAAVANRWSQMVAGRASVTAPGLLFSPVDSQKSSSDRSASTDDLELSQATLTPEQRLEQFRNFSSPMARRLAGLLAACPEINLPIVRMVQAAMLPESQQVHVAEVLLGGLFKPQSEVTAHTPADQVQYVFHESVQPLVQDTISPDKSFAALSTWLNHRFGYALEDFCAYVIPEHLEQVKPFAGVMLDVLKRRSNQYSELISLLEELERPQDTQQDTLQAGLQNTTAEVDFPDLKILQFTTAQLVEADPANVLPALQSQEVEVVTIVFESGSFEPEVLEPEPKGLELFEFESATLERSTDPPQTGFFQNLFRRRSPREETRVNWVIRKQRRQAYQWVEDLGDGIQLEMVAIPAGKFMMGSPEDELQRSNSEGPQHEVSVTDFFMGKYPVTQAQWKVVAAMPQVNRELDPDPSGFKGDNRPVEQLSWYEAVEFCDRLSAHTGREYRLPSEAEWEYACRAGTATPFCFGKTLTTELANYDGNYTYNDGSKGEYRQGTTPVDHFGIANAFGLCDMHGNVYEWCQDHWHDNYEGAPIDGSAWLSEDENAWRVIRGGSWFLNPWDCRSAYRLVTLPGYRSDHIGFRVVSDAPRTL